MVGTKILGAALGALAARHGFGVRRHDQSRHHRAVFGSVRPSGQEFPGRRRSVHGAQRQEREGSRRRGDLSRSARPPIRRSRGRWRRNSSSRTRCSISAASISRPTPWRSRRFSSRRTRLLVIFNAATSAIMNTSPLVVRTSFTTAQTTTPLGKVAFDRGIRKVISAVSDYGPGVDAEVAFKKAFEAAGGQVVEAVQDAAEHQRFQPDHAARARFQGRCGVRVPALRPDDARFRQGL